MKKINKVWKTSIKEQKVEQVQYNTCSSCWASVFHSVLNQHFLSSEFFWVWMHGPFTHMLCSMIIKCDTWRGSAGVVLSIESVRNSKQNTDMRKICNNTVHFKIQEITDAYIGGNWILFVTWKAENVSVGSELSQWKGSISHFSLQFYEKKNLQIISHDRKYITFSPLKNPMMTK